MSAGFAQRGPVLEPAQSGSAIIRFFASNSLLLMPFGVPGLKRTFGFIFLLAIGCTGFVSCGSYTAPKRVPSGLKFRVFVSNPLFVGASGTPSPALNIVDASRDLESAFTVSLAGSVSNAGMMTLSPNRAFSFVLSPTTNSVAVVNNTQETVDSVVNLPGPTQSIFVWSDNATGFAAVPSAPVSAAQSPSPGAVVVMNLTSSVISATIPVVGAQWIIDSHNGNRILALGSNPQTVTVISPSAIGTSTDPRTIISSSSFDHPVWAVFSSDDTTAYIFNCGAECGGAVASIAVLDLTQSPPQVTATIAVPAATYGLLNGATLFVAGTSPAGGSLTLISVASNAITKAIAIGDGYHNRMALSSNGQLFIGARTCSAGCLSIFNTATSAVVIPSASGDVTGIQPITGRTVVYVCQNGALNIYDATKDALQTRQVDIVGQAEDVELVDSP
jgi:hypothetical protein